MYRVNNVPVPQSVLAYYFGLLTLSFPTSTPLYVYIGAVEKRGVL